MRAVAMREDEPVAVLSTLNEAMIRQLDDQFCTVACARLKLAGGRGLELTVARGGHPAPLVLRSDGSVEVIAPPGKALGIFPDPELGDRSIRLEVGDAAVFYTDGVVEARGPDGSFFGERRLLDLLRAWRGLEAPAIAGKLKDVVVEHGEGYARDDLAVLVLRVPD
jgi:serine phosphatase RsbU (regulator of sigma subunit)